MFHLRQSADQRTVHLIDRLPRRSSLRIWVGLAMWFGLSAGDLPIGVADDVVPKTDLSESVAASVQGEYLGVLPSTCGPQTFGLQIWVTTAERLEGRLLVGGLPGAGASGVRWPGFVGELTPASTNSADPVALDGTPGRLELTSSSYRIELDPALKEARLSTSTGQSIGRLPRVERRSPTLGAPPVAGAVVLFPSVATDADTEGLSQRLDPVKLSPEGWLVRGAETRERYRDFYLHAEYRVPLIIGASGQARGNSGIYLQRRYEIQILDSFGREPEAGGTGAIYRYRQPDCNPAFPPLSWQTLDIEFRGARFDSAGRKTESARATVWLNGILIHNHAEMPRKTGAGREETPEVLPTWFQDHGDPVVFRNLWLIPRDEAPGSAAPVAACLPEQTSRVCPPARRARNGLRDPFGPRWPFSRPAKMR